MDIRGENITDLLTHYIYQEVDKGSHPDTVIDNMLLDIVDCLWEQKKKIEKENAEYDDTARAEYDCD